jgi:hypothetical protein
VSLLSFFSKCTITKHSYVPLILQGSSYVRRRPKIRTRASCIINFYPTPLSYVAPLIMGYLLNFSADFWLTRLFPSLIHSLASSNPGGSFSGKSLSFLQKARHFGSINTEIFHRLRDFSEKFSGLKTILGLSSIFLDKLFQYIHLNKSMILILVITLKVHKREKFFSSDFEFFTILYLVKLKY